ncbi:hypothetical protein NEIMUCOT_03808 [Neisseria mucosa ATCC 25996]|uniref:Uncharacterized protein n=1 Tax=Neisseria mucosa (strain ATCC 25996 / DSM 4631 / NCTC 10774 / M26) TaxID=546266 RepID=D2ZT72_NEIM2|nr:hypothetical protein NEIMUCOT_03808 [Neisseria mucosa ATCC 25996]
MLLKGRLKTDFLFSDDLFYWYFKSMEEGQRGHALRLLFLF